MLVQAAYYKAEYDKRKLPWQKGFFGYIIAKHARGTHCHEELFFDVEVIKAYFKLSCNHTIDLYKYHGKNNPVSISDHSILSPCSLSFSSSERDGGTRFRALDDVYNDPHKWDVFGVTDDMEKALEMLEFCVNQDHKKYDWGGVFGFKISLLNEDPEKWYCSEVCDMTKYRVCLFPAFYRTHPADSCRTQIFISEKGIQ